MEYICVEYDTNTTHVVTPLLGCECTVSLNKWCLINKKKRCQILELLSIFRIKVNICVMIPPNLSWSLTSGPPHVCHRLTSEVFSYKGDGYSLFWTHFYLFGWSSLISCWTVNHGYPNYLLLHPPELGIITHNTVLMYSVIRRDKKTMLLANFS